MERLRHNAWSGGWRMAYGRIVCMVVVRWRGDWIRRWGGLVLVLVLELVERGEMNEKDVFCFRVKVRLFRRGPKERGHPLPGAWVSSQVPLALLLSS